MPVTAIVVGPQRTGTSMVAGVLDALGVHMGDRIMPANAGNPSGYYEDLDFVELNDEILAAAGGAWDEPPSSERIAAVSGDFLRRIYRLVEEKNSARAPNEAWGWKDPRTSLTLPLYLGVVREPRVIVCKRDTDATVDSLVPFSQAFEAKVSERDSAKALAEEYNARITKAWLSASEMPMVRIDYDFARRHPRFIVEQLADYLEINPGDDDTAFAMKRILPVAAKHNYDEMERTA